MRLTSSSWRLAARLAWREVRRHWKRSLLIGALITVPIAAMTFGVGAYRGDHDRGPDTWYGVDASVDLAITSTDLDTVDEADITEHLPDGIGEITTAAVAWVPSVPVVTDGGGSTVTSVIDRHTDGSTPPVGTQHGRMATADDEVWMSHHVATDLGVEVGDTVALKYPRGDFTVVGIGTTPDQTGDLMVLPGLAVDQFHTGRVVMTTLVDLPAELSAEQINRTSATLTAALAGDADVQPVRWRVSPVGPSDATLAWGWVVGALSLAVIGIIVAAAFATTARQQLVIVGLLDANGAEPRLVRRALALQGFWIGLIASLVAALGGRAIAELLPIGPVQVLITDIVILVTTGTVAGTISALFPARSSSRVPVLTALAGRRPVDPPPAWLVPAGAVMFVAGVVALRGAAGSEGGNGGAVVGVIGGLLILSGVCCTTPLLVEAISAIGRRLGGDWRLSGRSLVRARSRSAAVVAAVAVAVAAGTTASTFAATVSDERVADAAPTSPRTAVVARSSPVYSHRGESIVATAIVEHVVPPSVQQRITDVLPDAEFHERRIASVELGPFEESENVATADDTRHVLAPPNDAIVVVDDAVADVYGLTDAERERLAESGSLLTFPNVAGDDIETVELRTLDGPIVLATSTRDPVAADAEEVPIHGDRGLLITERAATAAGLDIVVDGGYWVNDGPLASDQREAIDGLSDDARQAEILAAVYVDAPPVEDDSTLWIDFERGSGATLDSAAIQSIIVGVALVLMLGGVAIGLSLAAADSRDERDVLIAVGAKPKTMRRLAGARALLLAAGGIGLGIPAGLIPIVIVLRSVDDGDPVRLPYVGVALLAVVVPVVVGLAALASSAIAQRFRPPQFSTLAGD